MSDDMKQDETCEKYYSFIYYQCFKRLKNKDLAKDAAQTVVLIYLEKRHSFDENIVLSTWFKKTSLNVCHWVYYQQKKNIKNSPLTLDLQTSEETPQMDDKSEQQDLSEKISEGLNKISSYHRSILMLRYFENRTYIEIGYQLKKGEDAIRKACLVAEKKLKKVLCQSDKKYFNLILSAAILSKSFGTESMPKLSNAALQKYSLFAKSAQKYTLTKKLNMAALSVCLIGSGAFGFSYFYDSPIKHVEQKSMTTTKTDMNAENLISKMNQATHLDLIKHATTLRIKQMNNYKKPLVKVAGEMVVYKVGLISCEIISVGRKVLKTETHKGNFENQIGTNGEVAWQKFPSNTILEFKPSDNCGIEKYSIQSIKRAKSFYDSITLEKNEMLKGKEYFVLLFKKKGVNLKAEYIDPSTYLVFARKKFSYVERLEIPEQSTPGLINYIDRAGHMEYLSEYTATKEGYLYPKKTSINCEYLNLESTIESFEFNESEIDDSYFENPTKLKLR